MKVWPADWNERKRGKDCPICVDGRPEEFQFGIRIYSTAHTDAYLQRHGAVRGYAVVIWRGRHVAEPMEQGGNLRIDVGRPLLHSRRQESAVGGTTGIELPFIGRYRQHDVKACVQLR